MTGLFSNEVGLFSDQVPPSRDEFLKIRVKETYEMVARLYRIGGGADANLLVDAVFDVIFEVLEGKRKCNAHSPAFQELLPKIGNPTAASIVQAAEALLQREAFSDQWKDPRPEKRRQELENKRSTIRGTKHLLLKTYPDEEERLKQHCAALFAELEDKKLIEVGRLADAEQAIEGLEEDLKTAEKRAAHIAHYGAQLEANRRANVQRRIDERAVQERAIEDAQRAAADRRAAEAAQARERAKERLAQLMAENAGQPEGS